MEIIQFPKELENIFVSLNTTAPILPLYQICDMYMNISDKVSDLIN